MTFSSNNSKPENIPPLIPLSVSISITSPVMRVGPFSDQTHFDQVVTYTATANGAFISRAVVGRKFLFQCPTVGGVWFWRRLRLALS